MTSAPTTASGVSAASRARASTAPPPRTSARWQRLHHHEFWPTWLLYGLIGPRLAWEMLRRGSATLPSLCNPGIENGGGICGESKFAIQSRLRDPLGRVLPCALIPAGDIEARVRALRDGAAAIGVGYPFILKPDRGERGHGVKLVATEDQARAYLHAMRRDAVVQQYHPGPEECGIAWIRGYRPPGRDPRPDLAGRIYALTRKTFPVITGDGVSSLRELIERHPRFSLQASVFLTRFGAAAERTPARGELVRLAQSGNHCQGTRFSDGADLITPALEEAIDRIARDFPSLDSSPDGLDIGRFDLRYTNDDDLRAGRGFAIVELNGLTGEPTNIYDPQRGLGWALDTLFGQWREAYRLGAERRARGHGPTLGIRRTLALRREHVASLDGPTVAD